jgi:hypothetical protein
MADFAPITDQQRAANKAKRLAEAGAPGDGLCVRVLHKFASHGTAPGETVILSRDTALQAIKDDRAEIAE